MQMLIPMCLAVLLAAPDGAWRHAPYAPYAIWLPNLLATAFTILFLLRLLLRGIPRDLEDAARIDGCGFWRLCWHIVLPLARPVLALGGVLILIAAWDDAMVGTLGLAMACGLLFIAPVIAIFFLASRYFRKGGALAGAKG